MVRREVTVPRGAPKRGRLWAFGYPELAALFGLTPQRVRVLVMTGKLDPSDLEAVCREWARRRT